MKRMLLIVAGLLSGLDAQNARAEPHYSSQELIERLAGDTHWSATPELAKRFGDARAEIRSGFKHSNPVVRIRLIQLVKRSHDLSFYPDLLAMSKDPDDRVRGAVLSAAIEWGGDSGRQIIKELLTDESASNRSSAVSGLWFVDGIKSLPEINRIVDTDSDTVRVGVAVLMLAERGDRTVRGTAIELTKATFSSTRWNAIESLGYIGEASDMEFLKSIADSTAESTADAKYLRVKAKRAMKQLEFGLKGASEQRAILLDSLRSSDSMKRRWAVGELLRRGDAASRRILKKVSKDSTHPGSGDAWEALSINK